MQRRKPGECAKLKEQYARERDGLPDRAKHGVPEQTKPLSIPAVSQPSLLPMAQCFLKQEK